MNISKLFLITSYGLLIFSTVGFFLGVLGIFPKDEPVVILAISWLALIFTSFGNIVSAIVNKKVDKDGN
jgi:hypothetical membrane protein